MLLFYVTYYNNTTICCSLTVSFFVGSKLVCIYLSAFFVVCLLHFYSYDDINQEPRSRAWHFMVSTTTRTPEAAEALPPLLAYSTFLIAYLKSLRNLQLEIIRKQKYWRNCATYAVESIGKEQANRTILGSRVECV